MKLPALQLSNVGLPLPESYTHFRASMRVVVNNIYKASEKWSKLLQPANTKSQRWCKTDLRMVTISHCST